MVDLVDEWLLWLWLWLLYTYSSMEGGELICMVVIIAVGSQKHSNCVSSVHCSSQAHPGTYPVAAGVHTVWCIIHCTVIEFTTV